MWEDPNALHVYTDGSSRGRPRSGGVGVRIIFPDHAHAAPLELSLPGFISAPIGQMEIQACIEALKYLSKLDQLASIGRIIIHTDSQYVVDGYPAAKYTWPNSGWLKQNGAPVANASQWKELIKYAKQVCSRFRVSLDIVKVKGHSSDQNNEAADRLAKKSADNPRKRLTVQVLRRKKRQGTTEVGSIVGEGQRISLYIVSAEYLRVQKSYKLRAQVMSKTSKYFGKIDFVYSEEPLSAGHTFLVKIDTRGGHCIVTRIIRDLRRDAVRGKREEKTIP